MLTALVGVPGAQTATGDDYGWRLRVPPGFVTGVVASGLTRPTALAYGPDGRLYVAQETGEVLAIDARARKHLFASGFRTPLGLAWSGRTLFVSEQGLLERVRLRRDGTAYGRAVVVRGLPFGRHQQGGVVIGTNGRIYVSVNNRDDLGTWEPAETIVVLRRGARYGWPDCWPSWRRRQLSGSCAGITRPLAYLEPHSSPNGIVVYRSTAFPRAYRGLLFVAEWGQYVSERFGRKVVTVDPRTGRSRVFADGFDHPLALAVDRRGALLVADWGRGTIHRIEARGRK